MSSAQNFIGAHISLTSTSDIRYRGVLYGIDHQASTIQLQNVYSMGTENRRPAHEYLPPNPTPYEFIVFRATEVKDLAVEKAAPTPPLPQRSIHDDPAVIGASVKPAPAPGVAPTPATGPAVAAPLSDIPSSSANPTESSGTATGAPAETTTASISLTPNQENAGGTHTVASEEAQPANNAELASASIQSATAAVDTVANAIGDLRISNAHGGGGRGRGGRGRGRHQNNGQVPKGPGVVPETPFDFERANAKFNKPSNDTQSPTEEPNSKTTEYYNRSKSFFDDISSDSKKTEEVVDKGAAARARREEEKNRNLSTFGETGAWPVGSPQYNYARRGTQRHRRGGRGQ